MTDRSQPHAVATAADHAPAEGETDHMIRALVVAEKRSAKRHAFPELEPPVEAPVARRRSRAGSGRRALRSALPRPRHILLLGAVVLVFLYPLAAAAVVVLPLCIGFVVYLTLGPDRSAEGLAALWNLIDRRRPTLALSLQQRGNALALKFDALVDRLPEPWADALARPDLAQTIRGIPTDTGPDPFDRLTPPAEQRGN